MSLLTPRKPTTQTSAEVAFSNLLKSFGKNTQVRNLNDSDIWSAITKQDKQVLLVETGHRGTWPTTNNSVMRFQYQPQDEPYLEIDGERVANIVDHYVKVENTNEKEILDSDGVIKKPYIYGTPEGWASYEYIHEPEAKTASDDKLYTLGRGETLWTVARFHNIEALELAEHNDIDKIDMVKVGEGFTLHLPTPKRKPAVEKTVGYEVLPEARLMHIAKEGGAKKYSFGKVKDISDIAPSGATFKQGHPVKVVAIAHVPVVDNGTEKILAYYMDNNAYDVINKRVVHTIGYNWTHLEDGLEIAVPPSEQPVQDPPKQPIEPSQPDEPADIIIKEVVPWKTQYSYTYKPFADGAVWFEAKEDLLVRNLSTVRPPRQVKRGESMLIAGTFKLDGKLYGQPATGAQAGLAWAIPMRKLVEKITETEEDILLYNAPVEVPKRKLQFKNGRLTLDEVLISVPLSMTTSTYDKAVKYIKVKTSKLRSK